MKMFEYEWNGPNSPNCEPCDEPTILDEYNAGESIDTLVELYGLDDVAEELPLGDMIVWATERANRQKENASQEIACVCA
jgi:hypothetical protein